MTDVTARISHVISRIRGDIRVHARMMRAQLDADEDCSAEAQLLMRAQADLRLYLDPREGL